MALLGLLACPGLANADNIYSWIDDNGTLTFSNLPPPKGALGTEVVHDAPMPPQAASEATHRAEVSALNDRLRQLEFDMARAKREAVDYPAQPPAQYGSGCAPDDTYDCNGAWAPYYPVGLLYGTGRLLRDSRGYGHGGMHPYGRAPGGHVRTAHVAAAHGGGGGHGGRH